VTSRLHERFNRSNGELVQLSSGHYRPTKPPHLWRRIATISAGSPWTYAEIIAYINH
jgi:hypothetical protein